MMWTAPTISLLSLFAAVAMLSGASLLTKMIWSVEHDPLHGNTDYDDGFAGPQLFPVDRDLRGAKCDRRCIFYCGCDGYECQRTNGRSVDDNVRRLLDDVDMKKLSHKELQDFEDRLLTEHYEETTEDEGENRNLRFLGRCIDTDEEDELEGGYTVFVAPTDGRLVSFEFNGFENTIFGSNGKEIDIPLTVEMTSADGNHTRLELDESGNLVSMTVVDFEGVLSIFEFDSQPDVLGVKIFLPAQNYRGSFSFPPVGNSSSASLAGSPNNPSEGSGGNGGQSRPRASDNGERKLQGGSNPGSILINTVECSENVDPISLVVTATSEGNTVPVATQNTGTGQFNALFSVEDTEVSDEIVGAVCDGISTVAMACPFVIATAPGSVFICASISTALAATGVGAAIAGPAFTACNTAYTAATSFCVVYEAGGGGLPPGAPNLVDEICNAAAEELAPFIEDKLFLEEVTVTAVATFPTGVAVSGTSTFEPEAGSVGPSIILEGPGVPQLISFEAIPSNPVAFQDYTAFAFFSCVGAETSVALSISGTDGYTDSTTCVDADCSLSVPGAEAGVVDTLTLRITDPLIAGEVVEVIGLFFR